MSDPQFFKNHGPFSLQKLAKIGGAEVAKAGNEDYSIEDVAPLKTANAHEISFLDNAKYKDDFKNTKAGACIIHPDMCEFAPKSTALLLSKSPYKSYALIAQAFYPNETPQKAIISEHAIVDAGAKIGENVTIADGAVVKKGAEIGAHSWIEENAVIGENVKIGTHSRVGVGATLSHCYIGDHSRVYTGVRIGQDGFGFAIDPAGHVKVPQLGRVIIGDHVEIGANTTIDRGAGPDTIIGDGTWIDNLVQIGHNVQIGRGCVIVSQVGISGSTVIEDFVAIGGQAGIAGHLRIGQGVRIAAQTGVMRDIPAGEEHMGSPSMPIRQQMKQVAMLKRLIKNNKSN